MTFLSRSQAGQDLFVYKLLVKGEGLSHGSFLDVGANHPIDWSNTYELEQLGWRGFLFENEPNAAAMLRAVRQSIVMEGDVTKQDWRRFTKTTGKTHWDYLSLDVDYISHGVLLEMLVAGMSFGVATIEHNDYNYVDGTSPAWASRALMEACGYNLICRDVTNNNARFEDWWIQPPFVRADVAEPFRSNGRDGLQIVGLIK